MEYRLTIGLEVHAELKTATKLFCNSKNDSNESRPNVNICPVCMGYPGTLPVLNKEAVRHVLRLGLALGGQLADYTEFDRKNYFYPDIPKGYQISQYTYPLVSGGTLKGIALERVHLEEDTARSSHDKGDFSLIDFNRAGVPLMELVTKPVIHSGPEAVTFAKELQLLLRALEVGDANLEKGEMRIEANISVSATDDLGIKVEVKNLNSFRALDRAIAYERERHIALIAEGGKVTQETRGWDEIKQETFSQRLKESAHDYRYFPDPDVPKLVRSEIPEFSDEELTRVMPELPVQMRARYHHLGLTTDQVEILLGDTQLANIFEATVADPGFKNIEGSVTLLANYICSDISGLASTFGDAGLQNITPPGLGTVITHLLSGALSSRGAKDALLEVFEHGGDLSDVVRTFLQKSDKEELRSTIIEVIAEQGQVVKDYKNGKEAALQFLVGQGMKKTKGIGNPTVLKELLIEEIGR